MLDASERGYGSALTKWGCCDRSRLVSRAVEVWCVEGCGATEKMFGYCVVSDRNDGHDNEKHWDVSTRCSQIMCATSAAVLFKDAAQ